MTRFRTLILDCDSTLSELEGIQALANAAHAGELAELTELAMRGKVPLEQVYGRRLELIRPSAQAVAALGQRYIDTLVPDAERVVRTLLGAGVRIHIVSGGLRPPVLALGRHLGLADDCVHAVDIRFDAAGAYAGFDTASALARAGGKRELIAALGSRAPRPSLLVGDGATDLEARNAVDLFVAYSGVIRRPEVMAGAEVVLAARSLALLLPLVTGPSWGTLPAE